MSSECCKLRIPLMTYIKMQHEDCSIDCCDTEIDAMICVESDIYQDDEFPNLYKATCLFYELVDVVSINPVIIDMYGLLHHNIDIIREWIKENWQPEYHSLMDEDDGEWEYQFIASFERIINGNVGEKTAERYVKLFEQFQRVPAKADEMVLVPARQVMIEGEVVGPQWHNLQKDPTYLPDNTRFVWTNVGAGYHDDDGWWDDFGRLQGVVAWCEPEYKEA